MTAHPDLAPADAPRTTLWAALSVKDFRLIFTAQSISTLGDAAYAAVLAFFTYEFAGFSGAVGLVLGVVSVSTLVSLLVGGAVADRVHRKWVAVASDLFRLAFIGALGALVATDALSLPILVALTGLAGLVDGFFDPALRGAIPSLVPEEKLTSANGLLGFVGSTGVVIGAAAGGVLYATVGSATVFLLNAASFAASALLLSRLSDKGARGGDSSPPEEQPEEFARSVRSGIVYLTKVPVLVSIPVAAVALFIADAPTAVLTPELIADRLNGDASTIGWMNALVGCGAAIGALVTGHFGGGRRPAMIIFGSWGVAHLVTALTFGQTSATVAIVLSGIRGILSGLGGTLWNDLLMRNVDPRMLSRVFSLDNMGSSSLMPLGVVATGIVVGAWPAVAIVVIGQAVSGVLMLALLLRRPIRDA
ncbi:MFS transporter [Microbacterium sp.]|uniref:MFS transporter n=1 Tax=Microbacterium sp. TaxID=51671 RepID=UPI0039E3E4B6